jgi:hypothetical protein
MIYVGAVELGLGHGAPGAGWGARTITCLSSLSSGKMQT